jgi:hypothetical protein
MLVGRRRSLARTSPVVPVQTGPLGFNSALVIETMKRWIQRALVGLQDNERHCFEKRERLSFPGSNA